MCPAPELPRDVAILRHIGRYRLALYSILSALFFAGKDPGRVVGQLARKTEQRGALVAVHARALPGSLSYVTLSAAGATRVGVPKKRAEALGGPALDNALGLLGFCFQGRSRRHRLERPEVVAVYGPDAPPENVFHVATDELGAPLILRAVFATTADRRLLERLKRHLEEARRNPALREPLAERDYGFAVLVPWPDKIQAVQQLIAVSPLGQEATFVVDWGPTAETLPRLLKP